MTKKSPSPVSGIKPLFQLILIAFTSIILSSFFYFSSFRYYSVDVPPKTHGSPVNNENNRIPVDMDIQVQDFVKADFNQAAATINMLISLTHARTKLTKEDLASFYFKRAALKSKELIAISETPTHITYTWQVVAECTFDFDYSFFPLNDHMLSITLSTMNSSIIFKTANLSFLFSDTLDLNGWNIIKNESRATCSFSLPEGMSRGVPVSNVECAMALNKVGFRAILGIFLPLCILLFIALLTLSLNNAMGITLTINLLLALNAFRIVLENMSPKTSYLLMSDIIFLAILLMIALIFFIQVCIDWFSPRARYFLIALMHLVLIVLFFSFVKHWM